MTSHAEVCTKNSGELLKLLTAIAYCTFTLLPGSNTMMVFWPWVFVWQVSLALPIIWLIWQLWYKPLSAFTLGHHLDWVAGFAGFGIVLSSILADFPSQARWYGWAALCGLVAIYALRGWMNTPQRSRQVLSFQGYLGLGFILLSLGLWIAQILRPELARLQVIRSYGIDIGFGLRSPSIRNWQPIGHPNYVAGYLLLIMPLLVGLGLSQKGWQRWLWWAGAGLGLIDLYLTSSRGAWLGMMVAIAFALVLSLIYSSLLRLWLGAIGLAGVGGLLLFAFTNPRLQALIFSPLSGEGGQLAYRIITNVAGWRMGWDSPILGLGPGSVPIVYQNYRPAWAGWEAELVYQLHSTPAQLWAELGLIGIGVPIIAIALMSRSLFQWARLPRQGEAPVMVWCVVLALVAYGVMALTDYQLDNICITGPLLIFAVYLLQAWQPERKTQGEQSSNAAIASIIASTKVSRGMAIALAAFTVAVHIWLYPVHRAWALSSDGFTQLRQQNVAGFVEKLIQAHQIAPWEPYYPYQLGWNLGDLSFQASDPAQQQQLRQDAIAWFQSANEISPYQEFGHSNLGWLAINAGDIDMAVEAFSRSAKLVPAKKGVFFSLGFALMQQGKPELAAQAIALELVRQPILITSPVWQIGPLAAIADEIIEQTLKTYDQLETVAQDDTALSSYIHQNRGALHWWLGDITQAESDWASTATPLGSALLQLSQSADSASLRETVEALPETSAKYVLLAWLEPTERWTSLNKAWANSIKTEDLSTLNRTEPPENLFESMIRAMSATDSFREWFRMINLSWQPRSQRSGFGVLSRHVDGPTPSDFLPQIENIVASQLFTDIYINAPYMFDLDRNLYALKQNLLGGISKN